MSYDKGRKLRVCVLCSSYEGSDSELKQFDDLQQTPQWYFSVDDPTVIFETVMIKKATSFRTIRALVKSGKYDVFYNQCDGAKDEDRAGEEVVRALEEMNVPFTGSKSSCYELSKEDMKMLAHYGGIRTARHAVLERSEDVEEKCSQFTFPVIVKHVSGYSSIGMTKDCKCDTLEQLKNRVERFIKEFQSAFVEEFIAGDETTILACADASQPNGVRVFHPVQVRFPDGDDFKHFDLKWQDFDGMGWKLVEGNDAALPQMKDIASRAFRDMMDGVGYGRCDLRINRETNEVFFLEINPNCGIMYPPGQEGSADWILKLNQEGFHHKEFAMLQINEAIARHERERIVYRRDFDQTRGYHLRALEKIPKGRLIFSDEGRAFRLCTRPFIEKHWSVEQKQAFAIGAWPIGSERHYYAIWDHTPSSWRMFNHSCDPNMAFDADRSLNVVAIRDIAGGEELTMDYREFSDDAAASFQCKCGAMQCEGYIRFKQPRLTPTKQRLGVMES